MYMSGKDEYLLCKYCGHKVGPSTPYHTCPKCELDELVPEDQIVDPDLVWGTYGKNGDEEKQDKSLRECDTEHLKNILKTQNQISHQYRVTIGYLISKREAQTVADIPTEELPLHVNDDYWTPLAQEMLKKRLEIGR